MNESICFSVVTVCFNASKTIRRTIESVLGQDYDNVEYIIIDGLSTDNTIEIIKQYEIIKIVSEKDNGIYDAMNKGKKIAKGDYLLFLGADDVLYDSHVLTNMASQIVDRDVVYYGDVVFSDSLKRYSGNFNKWSWGYKNICQQSIFYPQVVYKNYDFDIKYKLAADWVYNLTLIKDSFRFIYVGLVISLYCHDGRSTVGVDPLFKKERKSIVIKAVGSLPYYFGLCRRLLNKIFHD